MNYRIEKDSMGEIKVLDDKYWGAQTQRSLENFKIGSEIMPKTLIISLAYLKKACALTNLSLNNLDENRASAIIKACEEIIDGGLDDHFPLVVWQTGSGTQTNMNINEVIANRAIELLGRDFRIDKYIHPNDHVNRSQSSNDIFPSAMHIAAIKEINKLLPIIDDLISSFKQKAKKFKNIIKIGRTHLQDATPLSLAQELSGYISMLEHSKDHILKSCNSLKELAIGGTAVGTGLNAPKDFDTKVCIELNKMLDIAFIPNPNKFHGLTSHDGLVFAHGAIKGLAANLMKIANDIRWLASGPRCGLGELILPANEPGSSIMPGKVNPTQCEALSMVAIQVMANDVAISLGASQGNFELNVYKPMIIYNFLQSITLLSDAIKSFDKNCIKGLKVDEAKIKYYLDNSLMLVTALSPHIGYEKAAKIAKNAYEKNISLKQSALELGINAKDYDDFIKPKNMIGEF